MNEKENKISRRNALIGLTAVFALSTISSGNKSPESNKTSDSLADTPVNIPKKSEKFKNLEKETSLSQVTQLLEKVIASKDENKELENDFMDFRSTERGSTEHSPTERGPTEHQTVWLPQIENFKNESFSQKIDSVIDESSKGVLSNSLPENLKEPVNSKKAENLFEKISKEELVKRINNPDAYYPGDILASEQELKLIKSTYKKLDMLKRAIVGVGNFNITDFPQLRKFARRWNKRKVSYRGEKRVFYKFTDEEMNFMMSVFDFDPKQYGIYGSKTINEFDNKIDKHTLYRPPRAINPNRHYIFEGKPKELFSEIIQKTEIFNSKRTRKYLEVILTSGVRGIPHQLTLFLNKCIRTKGNFSAACRSILFPGYSYHHLSDFDIGKKGFGYSNFNKSFKKTKEYKFLASEGILTLRYPEINNVDDLKDYDGVIYGIGTEYWHVYVDSEIRNQHNSMQKMLPTMLELSKGSVINPHAQQLFEVFSKIANSEIFRNPDSLAQIIQGIAHVETDVMDYTDDSTPIDEQIRTRRSILSSLLKYKFSLYS